MNGILKKVLLLLESTVRAFYSTITQIQLAWCHALILILEYYICVQQHLLLLLVSCYWCLICLEQGLSTGGMHNPRGT